MEKTKIVFFLKGGYISVKNKYLMLSSNFPCKCSKNPFKKKKYR